MNCPRCQCETQPGQKFCSECGERLGASCPACGTACAREQRYCAGCGALVSVSSEFASPQSYTPQHLAVRILTSGRALAGERKQITVVFADLRSSLELLADRDPEEARELLDPILERMIEGIHAYEGTVNQVMGDGIMALFGAPLAHEDHALRACYAALRIQSSIAALAADMRRRIGFNVQVRIGINSGEVVVRSIGSDLRMDYTAVGQTTHLAARMEQLAPPGRIFVTDRTHRLVEGVLALRSLGPTPVRGMSESVEIYELVSGDAPRSRLQAAALRGLSRFIGRDDEVAMLERAQSAVSKGAGQVVAIVGEPGVGKSRLIREFVAAQVPAGWRVVETTARSYASNPYLVATEAVRQCVGLDAGADHARIRERLTAHILERDVSLLSSLPALLALLGADVEEPSWVRLEPRQRRQATVEAVKRLLVREALASPFCLVVEDLQWLDADSQAVLDALVDSLPAASLLLLVSYRAEYRHGWAARTYYTQLRVDPLPPPKALLLTRALVGSAGGLDGLVDLLIARTQGNPFFLEETVRDLAEAGVLAGERGAYQLARSVAAVQVPSTVQAVLAARVDRVRPEDKTVLETMAIFGKAVTAGILEAIGPLPGAELQASLARLREAEFIYEAALFPEPAYAFKHALIQEVAAGTLLHDARRALHARIVDALERSDPARVDDDLELVADHAVAGEVWAKAADYLARAAAKGYGRGALAETVDRYERALAAMARLPQTPEQMARGIDVRLQLHAPLMALGHVERLTEIGIEAQEVARKLADRPRLGRVVYQLGYYAWVGARYDESDEHAARALDLAVALHSPSLELRSRHLLALNRMALGDYPAATEALARVVGAVEVALARRNLGALMSSVDALSWLAYGLAMVGDFKRAAEYGDRAVELAEASQHPQSQAIAWGFRATVPILKGDFSLALSACERAAELCRAKAVVSMMPTIYSFWGHALAWLGHHAEALPLLQDAVRVRDDMKVRTHAALGHVRWAEGLLLAGSVVDARDEAEYALGLARRSGERGHEALALHVLAETATEPETAITLFEQASALADKLGMRPLAARCRLGHGRCLARAARRDEARHVLTAAAGEFEAMEMGFWRTRVSTALQELG